MKDKKVLITGGAGFIGANLAERLLSIGADVTILDVISKIGTKNIDDFKDSVTVFDLDISDDNSYKNLEKDFDYIFHLAAIASLQAFEKNPELGFKINVEGTNRILEFASKTNVKKFIFPSAGTLYGKYPKYVPIDEQHPIDPSADKYSMSKKMAEDLCKTYFEDNSVPTLVYRLFAAFGPRQAREYLIPTVILQAMKNKKVEIWNDKPTRDFNYIDNLIDAFVRGAESNFKGGPLNIGSGVERTVGDVVRLIASKFDAEVVQLNKEVLGPMRLCSDISLAKKTIGYEPKVSFEEGVDKTIEWFYKNQHLY